MKSVIFNITTHNHQPIGNFDFVLEDAYQQSYKPFFEVAEKYPSVLFSTHFSGFLLKWLLRVHPEYRATIELLVKRGQLDLLSGGFYEPMLSVIPIRDQGTQIEKLTAYIQTEFGYHAEGMWLAERVWDQPLAAALHDAHVRFTLLDDTHFLSAGLDQNDLDGYYLTEAQGKVLAIFPIQKSLRYTMPFQPVEETIRVLRDAASDSGDNIVCFADDGEKFGVWPSTYHSVYEEGWLDEFFRKIDENRSWIKTMHGGEILNRVKPKGRIYLPNSSYAEMMEWALPTSQATQAYEDFTKHLSEDNRWKPYMKFVRGGFWPNFFVKYPESNHLHKRMMQVSARLESTKRRKGEDQNLLLEAEEHLFAAQCNDAYWHGVFGGIYLNNLRHALFTELLQAEALLDSVEKSKIRIAESDFDRDGGDELQIATGMLSCVIAPERGGMIAEFDYMPKCFNANNILNRLPEAYHAKLRLLKDAPQDGEAKSIHDMVLSKEEGLERHLIHDWYRHGSFLEHFFPPEITLDQFASMQFEERGDFMHSTFTHRIKKGKTMLFVELERNGMVWMGGIAYPTLLKKSLEFIAEEGQIKVTYEIVNDSSETLLFRFGSEWVCNFLAGNAPDRYYEADGEKLDPPQLNCGGVVTNSSTLRIVDDWMKLAFRIACEAPTDFWRTPLETVSLSETGFERVYQGSIVMPIWDVELAPGATWNQAFVVGFDAE